MISLKEKGILLTKAYEDEVEQVANGKYQLSFKYPTSDDNWTAILPGALILADDLHGEQEFRIFEVTKRHGYLYVYAEQVADDLNKYSISSISVDRVTGGVVMSNLAGSIIRSHPFSFYSDIDTLHTFNEKNVSAMSALAEGKHSILGQWGGDLVRDKYQISLLKNGGRDSEALFMYQKNLKTYVETDSIKDLVTRLHLSIKDSDVTTTVDSPLLEAYNGRIYELSIEVSDQDVQTVDHLQEYGRNYFAKNLVDIPNNSLEIAVTDNQEYDVRIFDTVFVHHKVFGKDLRMKITSYKFSPMGRKLKSIGFGKIKTSLAQQVSNIATEVAEQSVSVAGQVFEEKLQKEIENADKVIDGKINKVRDEINDGIEQSKADAEAYADNIKQQIDGQLAESNRQYQAEKQVQDRQIADVLAKANANANLVSDAQRVANQAKSDAANALASATQLKADAVNEAQRLVNTLKTETVASSNQLKQQIETVGNQLSSQQAELLQATQTVRGLDTQVKSVANQLGTQQTTITQLVNDGNARGQKIADFETSLDGVTTKLQNLWNGSRNLLSNTELLTGYEGVLPYPKNHYLNKAVFRWTHKATDTTFKEGLVMQVNDTLVNPKEMIVSFYAAANRSTTIRCYMFNPNGRKAVETSTGYTATNVDGYAEVTIGTAWRRYWVRYTYQVGYVAKPYVIIGRSPDTVTSDSTVSIVAPALYHGHYNRDWQPSDVDMMSDFAIYKQTIDQNLAQLGSDIRTANGSVTSLRTEYNQTKTEIALLASKSDFDALTQKTQSLEASLNVQAGQIGLKAEKTSIDSINQQISSAQAELTVVNDAIAQRVTKTDFNAVKRTAEANATAITQVNNAIELKAEKTYVDGIKSTADSALAKANTNASTITQTKAELKIANDAIDTKATKTDLNNLTGRMTTAETTIRTQAGQIEQRLTSTQVNELVDSKGYATSSSVQNVVKETADSFSRTISAVENKIPTEAGGTNLVRGSADLKQGANGWREGHWRNSGSGGTVEYNATLPSSPVKGIVKGVKIVNNDNNQIGLCQDGITLEPGTYTMSVWVIGRRGLKVHVSGAYSQDTSNPLASGNTFVTLGRYGWTLISQTFTLDKRYENLTLGYMMLDSAGTVYFAAPYIHKSSMLGDWSPAVEDLATITALHEVKDTVSSHTRTISALDGSVSQAIQTAAGILSRVGTLESNVADKSSVSAVQNQVSQLAGSWAVQNLTSSGQILNQINLLANGTNRIDGRLTHITGQTLIDNGVINNAMIGNLDAGKITTGYLASARIATNSITGNHMVFDQAFVNKMTANEALFKQLFAQSAFITSVQAVAISATQIVGGIIKSTNNSIVWDLNAADLVFNTNAKIRFNDVSNTISYTKNGTTGLLKFNNADYNAPEATFGVNRNGDFSSSNGMFSGIRVRGFKNTNGSFIDEVYAIGDDIYLTGGYGEQNGFRFSTAGDELGFYPRANRQYALGSPNLRFTTLYLDEVNIRASSTKSYNLREALGKLAAACGISL
ncbi:phage tail spike protein [Streptococcus suis]|uniref:phage tail spike protein n=1 Tax=Streptococcus suis TaxID=1307 RepID=UPI001E38CBDA|nr:phage tail spike protein [Streptococcus suis]MCB2859540.1 phage tail protein [Streptococcus suis]MCB2868076.1 phage tail protein [Streptococcus suis]